MPDLVRVRLDNGSHKSIDRARAEALGLKPLKQDALKLDGTPAPTKPRVPLGGAATPNEADASKSKED